MPRIFKSLRPAGFAVLVLAALPACSPRELYRTSYTRDVTDWPGRTAAELIQAWGRPDVSIPDPSHRGGKILTYHHTLATTGPTPQLLHELWAGEPRPTERREFRNESPDPSVSAGVIARSQGTFWVDSLGVITRVDPQ